VTTGFLIIKVYYKNKTNYKYSMILNGYINKQMLTNLEAKTNEIMCEKKTSEYINVG